MQDIKTSEHAMSKKLFFLSVVLLILSACGGGGSDDAFKTPPSNAGGGGGGGGGGGTTTVALGSGTGAAFQSGVIGVAGVAPGGSLSAGGSATLQVSLVDQTGAQYIQAATVTFSSACLSLGTSQINPALVDTTGTGVATATYVARGCVGDDVITASATVLGVALTATATINVQAAAIGSIEFVSATPINIGLKGTGRAETSTVVFRVVDSSGGPRQGAAVALSLDTVVGGVSLSTTTATSGADGTVQTVVSAGTVATSVRVTARITTPALATQSSRLSITTGLPDTDSFSMSVLCPNVEAFNSDGVTVPVTVRLSDRYNNPVPDGTAITFNAEGGQIGGSCVTPSSSTTLGDGTCRVNWVSSDPRPTTPGSAGRITLLASAIGEDSFVDTNANGFFDSGEAFANLGEPYRDDNESASYTSGEYFVDFNNNAARDGGDGVFSGIVCTGTLPTSTCTLSTTSIGATAAIIMSTSGALISGPASVSSTANNSVTLNFNVQDLNGNAMPSGTTITVTTNGNIGTIDPATSSVRVPCDAGRGGLNFSTFLTTPSTLVSTATGNITITVTSPAGLITRAFVPVTVTP